MLSAARPGAPLPDGFYTCCAPARVAPPGGPAGHVHGGTASAIASPHASPRLAAMGRPFGLLEELEGEPADEGPPVLLVRLSTDPTLQRRLAEARALTLPLPPAARPAVLALLVSSWLGGHWSDADEQAALAEGVAWRRRAGTNVLPLGAVRRGGRQPRALLFKLLFDHVPLGAPHGAPGEEPAEAGPRLSCELRRGREGRVECSLRGVAVDLHAP